MISSPYLIATRFQLTKDSVVVGCLQEMLANRTTDLYIADAGIDTAIYRTSAIVKNQITDSEVIDYS